MYQKVVVICVQTVNLYILAMRINVFNFKIK